MSTLLRRSVVVVLFIFLSATYSNAFLIFFHRSITKIGLSTVETSLSADLVPGRLFTGEAIREIVNANMSRDTGDCAKSTSKPADEVPSIPCGATDLAFDDLEKTTDPGALDEAIAGIKYAEVNDSADHFDDEGFAESNARIGTERDLAVSDLKSGYYVAARKQVGYALHTIQDFYAHSSWVDLGLGCCLTRLGYPDAFKDTALAGKYDATCDNPWTLLSDLEPYKSRLARLPLTSGYFPNTASEIAKYHKCQHGSLSPFDDKGINKDYPVVYSGTRTDRYTQAFNLAAAHTTLFVNGLLREACGTNSACVYGFMGYPTISSITPTIGNVGQGQFHLVVSGTGFSVDNAKTNPTVMWNGKPLVTIPYVTQTATRLEVYVDPENLTGPGVVNVTVKQFEIDIDGKVTTNPLVSNAVNFTVNGPEPPCPGDNTRAHSLGYTDVHANKWNDAGVIVEGVKVKIEALPGRVVWRAGGLLVGPDRVASPVGDATATPANTLLWVEPQIPITQIPIGGLIGMVLGTKLLDDRGNPTMPLIEKPDGAQYFPIRMGGEFLPKIAGRLYLGINDGAFFNNAGCFEVKVTKTLLK